MSSSINRFNPFEEIRALERTFFGDNSVSDSLTRSANRAPATDVYTRDGEYVIEAHLPGVKKEEVSVDVDDGRLTVSTQRHEREEEHEGRDYLVRETTSSFTRTVRLPEGADVNAITARLDEGVLTVTVPVPQAVEKKRTIEVTAGETEKDETRAVESEDSEAPESEAIEG
ncbi:Hsp20/alpha crystallin family protein [Corynebacterium guangdongense]|uniref:HSP20 family protein n=1 Tax=Corynebacterium guangdongense TaxID=1783348 RepID=A0ABU1ZZR7_9CORY|nr:Hsp20/alpha crystallin family protein [Corynebacterium guangdongense]MDR7330437.1 HSP20 family protein [Corynebacterium guangdongense]WJZ18995.1 Alpha-crystallin [Corynebacterium guangdongense]